MFFERGREITKELISNRLSDFLFTYRTTPSSVIGISPAECIFKFRSRTRFDLIKPSNISKGTDFTSSKKIKVYFVEDLVYITNF